MIPLSLLECNEKESVLWTLNTFGVSTDFTKTVGKKQCRTQLFPWRNIAKEEKKQQTSINSCNRLWQPPNFANWRGKVVLEGEWTWVMSNFLTSSCTIYTDKKQTCTVDTQVSVCLWHLLKVDMCPTKTRFDCFIYKHVTCFVYDTKVLFGSHLHARSCVCNFDSSQQISLSCAPPKQDLTVLFTSMLHACVWHKSFIQVPLACKVMCVQFW